MVDPISERKQVAEISIQQTISLDLLYVMLNIRTEYVQKTKQKNFKTQRWHCVRNITTVTQL